MSKSKAKGKAAGKRRRKVEFSNKDEVHEIEKRPRIAEDEEEGQGGSRLGGYYGRFCN
eukprot:m.105665 g.105665  ORF g.105665 m.105665 type:complete len:58 (-) comp13886_c0_seq3:2300-2473(-)